MAACDWEPIYSDCDCEGTCCHIASLSPDMAAAIELTAAEWLWESTNRRYGNCPVTFRACVRRCDQGYGYGYWPAYIPYKADGSWFNISCGACGDNCSCTTLSEVILPTVGTVTEVALDGVPMTGTAWRVDNMRRLVRVDGGRWPTCQDMTAEPAEWTVTYVPGLPLPTHGQIAYGQLVCQIARLVCGEKCQLPAGVTSVSRQGVTINVSPAADALTGLWMVDSWTAMVNRAQARVWSPDLHPTRVVNV